MSLRCGPCDGLCRHRRRPGLSGLLHEFWFRSVRGHNMR